MFKHCVGIVSKVDAASRHFIETGVGVQLQHISYTVRKPDEYDLVKIKDKDQRKELCCIAPHILTYLLFPSGVVLLLYLSCVCVNIDCMS